jgi:MerR family transcriptional regulator, light-induced transcriptional regulator
MANFASRLRRIRKERRLRQKDLADALNVAQTTIANYEQNARFPDQRTLARIADFFDVSLDYLMGRTDIEVPMEPAREPEAGADAAELSTYGQSYVQALLAGRRDNAWHALADAERAGYDIPQIYVRIIEPAMVEIGRRWANGQADVFQEHFASNATTSFMAAYMAAVPLPRTGPVVIGVTVGGEFHDIGIRMVMDLLLLDGFDAHYLGINLPTESLLRAIAEREAKLVCISVTMPYLRNAVADLIRVLKRDERSHSIRILVGGRGFLHDPEAWRDVRADGYASNARQAVETAHQLFANV